MAECAPEDKSATGEVDLTSISNILGIILGVFGIMQLPTPPIPPPLLLIGKNLRPGMSARNLAARTISRVESETGKSMGNVYSDGPNVDAATIKLMSEEMVSMVQTEAAVSIHIDAADMAVAISGAGGGGVSGRGIVT